MIGKKQRLIFAALAVLLLGGGGYYWYRVATTTPTTATTSEVARSVDLDNGDEAINWDSLPTKTITLGSTALAITEPGTYILSGTTTAGVTVNTEGNVRIALSGATITSSSGAAIYIENAENTVIQLVEGTKNVVEDATTRTDETIDGAIYSSDDLTLNGTGTLTVTAKFADAIVSTDDLKIVSGTYTIKSADDGIRGKDSVYIVDGTITIDAAGDAVKATNDTDATKGYVYVAAGTLTIAAGDDAIHAEEKVVIVGSVIAITTSAEGIEGASVTIDGGTITLYATDDGINAPGSSFTNAVITINAGTVTVEVGPGDTDGIDANGDIYINGGTITVTAQTSSFDYDGTAELNGGTVTINGERVTSIPQSMMGGGFRR